MRLKAVDELTVCDGPAIDGSAQHKVRRLGDPTAAVDAVGPLRGIARQVLGAEPTEGAVPPRLDVGEQPRGSPAGWSRRPALRPGAPSEPPNGGGRPQPIDAAIEAVRNPPGARCDRGTDAGAAMHACSSA